jgi:hypothetical protein
MATLRNLGIGILKLGGYHGIAAATRYHARDATRTLATLGLSLPDRNNHHPARPPAGP